MFNLMNKAIPYRKKHSKEKKNLYNYDQHLLIAHDYSTRLDNFVILVEDSIIDDKTLKVLNPEILLHDCH